MAPRDWDFFMWQRANDLMQQVERIQRNFFQIALGAQYRALHGRICCWEPPVNLIENDEALWVISALPGVTADQLKVRLEGAELVITGERPMPKCCQDGDLKLWEIPIGVFERRLNLAETRETLSLGQLSLQDGLLIIELRKHS